MAHPITRGTETQILVCRFVPHDQWLSTHIAAHWKIKHLKQHILAKCLGLSYTPPAAPAHRHLHSVSLAHYTPQAAAPSPANRPPSPITFAPDPRDRPASPILFAQIENARESEDSLGVVVEEEAADIDAVSSVPGGRVLPSASHAMIVKPAAKPAKSKSKSSKGQPPAQQPLILLPPTHPPPTAHLSFTLLRLSTGQIMEDEYSVADYELGGGEIVEVHAGVVARGPLQLHASVVTGPITPHAQHMKLDLDAVLELGYIPPMPFFPFPVLLPPNNTLALVGYTVVGAEPTDPASKKSKKKDAAEKERERQLQKEREKEKERERQREKERERVGIPLAFGLGLGMGVEFEELARFGANYTDNSVGAGSSASKQHSHHHGSSSQLSDPTKTRRIVHLPRDDPEAYAAPYWEGWIRILRFKAGGAPHPRLAAGDRADGRAPPMPSTRTGNTQGAKPDNGRRREVDSKGSVRLTDQGAGGDLYGSADDATIKGKGKAKATDDYERGAMKDVDGDWQAIDHSIAANFGFLGAPKREQRYDSSPRTAANRPTGVTVAVDMSAQFEWRARWLVIRDGWAFLLKERGDSEPSHAFPLSNLVTLRDADQVAASVMGGPVRGGAARSVGARRGVAARPARGASSTAHASGSGSRVAGSSGRALLPEPVSPTRTIRAERDELGEPQSPPAPSSVLEETEWEGRPSRGSAAPPPPPSHITNAPRPTRSSSLHYSANQDCRPAAAAISPSPITIPARRPLSQQQCHDNNDDAVEDDGNVEDDEREPGREGVEKEMGSIVGSFRARNALMQQARGRASPVGGSPLHRGGGGGSLRGVVVGPMTPLTPTVSGVSTVETAQGSEGSSSSSQQHLLQQERVGGPSVTSSTYTHTGASAQSVSVGGSPSLSSYGHSPTPLRPRLVHGRTRSKEREREREKERQKEREREREREKERQRQRAKAGFSNGGAGGGGSTIDPIARFQASPHTFVPSSKEEADLVGMRIVCAKFRQPSSGDKKGMPDVVCGVQQEGGEPGMPRGRYAKYASTGPSLADVNPGQGITAGLISGGFLDPEWENVAEGTYPLDREGERERDRRKEREMERERSHNGKERERGDGKDREREKGKEKEKERRDEGRRRNVRDLEAEKALWDEVNWIAGGPPRTKKDREKDKERERQKEREKAERRAKEKEKERAKGRGEAKGTTSLGSFGFGTAREREKEKERERAAEKAATQSQDRRPSLPMLSIGSVSSRGGVEEPGSPHLQPQSQQQTLATSTTKRSFASLFGMGGSKDKEERRVEKERKKMEKKAQAQEDAETGSVGVTSSGSWRLGRSKKVAKDSDGSLMEPTPIELEKSRSALDLRVAISVSHSSSRLRDMETGGHEHAMDSLPVRRQRERAATTTAASARGRQRPHAADSDASSVASIDDANSAYASPMQMRAGTGMSARPRTGATMTTPEVHRMASYQSLLTSTPLEADEDHAGGEDRAINIVKEIQTFPSSAVAVAASPGLSQSALSLHHQMFSPVKTVVTTAPTPRDSPASMKSQFTNPFSPVSMGNLSDPEEAAYALSTPVFAPGSESDDEISDSDLDSIKGSIRGGDAARRRRIGRHVHRYSSNLKPSDRYDPFAPAPPPSSSLPAQFQVEYGYGVEEVSPLTRDPDAIKQQQQQPSPGHQRSASMATATTIRPGVKAGQKKKEETQKGQWIIMDMGSDAAYHSLLRVLHRSLPPESSFLDALPRLAALAMSPTPATTPTAGAALHLSLRRSNSLAAGMSLGFAAGSSSGTHTGSPRGRSNSEATRLMFQQISRTPRTQPQTPQRSPRARKLSTDSPLGGDHSDRAAASQHPPDLDILVSERLRRGAASGSRALASYRTPGLGLGALPYPEWRMEAVVRSRRVGMGVVNRPLEVMLMTMGDRRVDERFMDDPVLLDAARNPYAQRESDSSGDEEIEDDSVSGQDQGQGERRDASDESHDEEDDDDDDDDVPFVLDVSDEEDSDNRSESEWQAWTADIPRQSRIWNQQRAAGGENVVAGPPVASPPIQFPLGDNPDFDDDPEELDLMPENTANERQLVLKRKSDYEPCGVISTMYTSTELPGFVAPLEGNQDHHAAAAHHQAHRARRNLTRTPTTSTSRRPLPAAPPSEGSSELNRHMSVREAPSFGSMSPPSSRHGHSYSMSMSQSSHHGSPSLDGSSSRRPSTVPVSITTTTISTEQNFSLAGTSIQELAPEDLHNPEGLVSASNTSRGYTAGSPQSQRYTPSMHSSSFSMAGSPTAPSVLREQRSSTNLSYSTGRDTVERDELSMSTASRTSSNSHRGRPALSLATSGVSGALPSAASAVQSALEDLGPSSGPRTARSPTRTARAFIQRVRSPESAARRPMSDENMRDSVASPKKKRSGTFDRFVRGL